MAALPHTGKGAGDDFWTVSKKLTIIQTSVMLFLRYYLFAKIEKNQSINCLADFLATKVTRRQSGLSNQLSLPFILMLASSPLLSIIRAQYVPLMPNLNTLFEKSIFCPKIQFWQNPNIFTSFSIQNFFDNFSREIKVVNS